MSEENRKKRICREFARLVEIDAPSFGERQMADYLKKKLAELGAEVEEDKAGEVIGGNAGNILGILKGTLPGPPVLLCAHMDTVAPAPSQKSRFSGRWNRRVLQETPCLVQMMRQGLYRFWRESAWFRKQDAHTGIWKFSFRQQKKCISKEAVPLILQNFGEKRPMSWIFPVRWAWRQQKPLL